MRKVTKVSVTPAAKRRRSTPPKPSKPSPTGKDKRVLVARKKTPSRAAAKAVVTSGGKLRSAARKVVRTGKGKYK